MLVNQVLPCNGKGVIMAERLVGTVSRGIRAPIIREGDDIAKIVVDSVISASEAHGFAINNRDVIAVTEAVVARAQGNYATVEDVANDVKQKFAGETVGVIFPILSSCAAPLLAFPP